MLVTSPAPDEPRGGRSSSASASPRANMPRGAFVVNRFRLPPLGADAPPSGARRSAAPSPRTACARGRRAARLVRAHDDAVRLAALDARTCPAPRAGERTGAHRPRAGARERRPRPANLAHRRDADAAGSRRGGSLSRRGAERLSRGGSLARFSRRAPAPGSAARVALARAPSSRAAASPCSAPGPAPLEPEVLRGAG